jgi:hypothetical protein
LSRRFNRLRLEDDVSGMDMTGSGLLDGKDSEIRIGRGGRVRPWVMWVQVSRRHTKLERCRRRASSLFFSPSANASSSTSGVEENGRR